MQRGAATTQVESNAVMHWVKSDRHTPDHIQQINQQPKPEQSGTCSQCKCACTEPQHAQHASTSLHSLLLAATSCLHGTAGAQAANCQHSIAVRNRLSVVPK